MKSRDSLVREAPPPSQRLTLPMRIARLYRLPRWLQVLSGLLLLLGSGIAYRVYDYTENDPNFCQSCHIMREAWDRWATSEHRRVNCHACHHQSKIEGLRQVWLTVVKQPEKVGPHGHLPLEVCQKCHFSGNPRWKQVAATAGHQVHAERERIPCWKCHAKSIHRFRPPSEICKECHTKQHIEVAPMGRLHCTNCHNFLAHQVALLPTRQDCLWCHQKEITKRVIFREDSPMKFECQKCHNPHKKQSPLSSCQGCHQGIVASVRSNAQTHRNCLSCHRPHTWKTQGDKTCRSCHSPLPEGMGHQEGHKILQCTDCHHPHNWKTQRNGLCRTCHRRAEFR